MAGSEVVPEPNGKVHPIAAFVPMPDDYQLAEMVEDSKSSWPYRVDRTAVRRHPGQGHVRLAVCRRAGLEPRFALVARVSRRPHQLTGLRWDDVDQTAGTLGVAVSLKRQRGQLRLGDPKTPNSNRTVDMRAPLRLSPACSSRAATGRAQASRSRLGRQRFGIHH
jgi:hypothetical protein